MNMSHPLSPGTIQSIFDGNAVKEPWVQIIHLKSFEKDNATNPRYKIIVSDSKRFIQGTLATNLNHLIESGTLEVNAIVRLVKYAVNNIKNHRLVFIGEVSLDDIIRVPGRIGEPTNVDIGSSQQLNTATAPVSTMAQQPMHAAASSFAPRASSNSKPLTTATSLPESFQLIASLSPYKDRNSIRARVTSKSEIKQWTNERGDGRLFSVNLLDSSSEIRLTCFNDTVDQFFDLLQVGKVYDFINFQVKISKRQFGNVKNEYEISADSQMTINVVLENADEIPSVHYEFVPIANMANAEKDSIVDVIGVVKEAGELSQITTKTTQKQLNKRDLTIVDMSKGSIKLTLWGKQAEDYANELSPVIVVKGARVNEYQGRTLSTTNASNIAYNPDIPECHTLRGWYDSHGGHVETAVNVSSVAVARDSAFGAASRDDRKLLSQVKDENLGMSEKPDYFSVLATVAYIKADQGNISYMACPGENCNKKVVEEGPNQFRCERCQKVYDRCNHCYVMSVQISDPTAAIWVNAFGDIGTVIMGRSAEESYYMKMENAESFQAVVKERLLKQYLFRVRAKQEYYNGEMRLRCNLMSAQPVDFVQESEMIISKLEAIDR